MRSLAEATVYRGLFADRLPGLSRTYPAGRVCLQVGCGAVLSIYNPDKGCSLHAPFARLFGGPGLGRKKAVA